MQFLWRQSSLPRQRTLCSKSALLCEFRSSGPLGRRQSARPPTVRARAMASVLHRLVSSTVESTPPAEELYPPDARVHRRTTEDDDRTRWAQVYILHTGGAPARHRMYRQHWALLFVWDSTTIRICELDARGRGPEGQMESRMDAVTFHYAAVEHWKDLRCLRRSAGYGVYDNLADKRLWKELKPFCFARLSPLELLRQCHQHPMQGSRYDLVTNNCQLWCVLLLGRVPLLTWHIEDTGDDAELADHCFARDDPRSQLQMASDELPTRAWEELTSDLVCAGREPVAGCYRGLGSERTARHVGVGVPPGRLDISLIRAVLGPPSYPEDPFKALIARLWGIGVIARVRGNPRPLTAHLRDHGGRLTGLRRVTPNRIAPHLGDSGPDQV